MSRNKVTFEWRQGEFEATETYWMPEGIPVASMSKTLNDFLQARVGCMFENQTVSGVRVSEEGSTRRGILLPVGPTPWPNRDSVINVPSKGTLKILVSTRPDMIRVALNMRMLFGDPERTSTRYFSSVPENVVTFEPNAVDVSSGGKWWDAFKAFRSILTGRPWFIRMYDNSAPNDPRKVARTVRMAAAPSFVGLAFSTGTAPDWVAGDRIRVTKFRHRPCTCPTLKGIWEIDSVSDTATPGFTTFFLAGSERIDPTTVKTNGFAQKQGFTFGAINDALLIRGGIHKRGNGASRRRGRRSTRVCCP